MYVCVYDILYLQMYVGRCVAVQAPSKWPTSLGVSICMISQCFESLDLSSPVFCRRAVQVPSTWPIYPLCMYMCVCMSVSVLV